MLELKSLAVGAVAPVSVSLKTGECLGVVGPSGAGKSRLLRAVADLDPHGGDCALNGLACSAMAASQWRRQVIYLPTESAWWEDDVAAHFPADKQEALKADLPKVGLPPEAALWPVSRLSSGEKQRLALLRALAYGPKVLLADEPTGSLDEHHRGLVEALLKDFLTQGGILILVSHDPAQRSRLAHRELEVAAPAPLEVAQ